MLRIAGQFEAGKAACECHFNKPEILLLKVVKEHWCVVDDNYRYEACLLRFMFLLAVSWHFYTHCIFLLKSLYFLYLFICLFKEYRQFLTNRGYFPHWLYLGFVELLYSNEEVALAGNIGVSWTEDGVQINSK